MLTFIEFALLSLTCARRGLDGKFMSHLHMIGGNCNETLSDMAINVIQRFSRIGNYYIHCLEKDRQNLLC